jgi:hypothetical protein
MKAKGGAAKGVGRRGKNAVESNDRIPTLAEQGILIPSTALQSARQKNADMVLTRK